MILDWTRLQICDILGLILTSRMHIHCSAAVHSTVQQNVILGQNDVWTTNRTACRKKSQTQRRETMCNKAVYAVTVVLKFSTAMVPNRDNINRTSAVSQKANSEAVLPQNWPKKRVKGRFISLHFVFRRFIPTRAESKTEGQWYYWSFRSIKRSGILKIIARLLASAKTWHLHTVQ